MIVVSIDEVLIAGRLDEQILVGARGHSFSNFFVLFFFRSIAQDVVATQQIAVHEPSDDVERTVRLIEDGNVIHEATIRRGDILAEF